MVKFIVAILFALSLAVIIILLLPVARDTSRLTQPLFVLFRLPEDPLVVFVHLTLDVTIPLPVPSVISATIGGRDFFSEVAELPIRFGTNIFIAGGVVS